jgi:hypothetical protein
MVEPRRATRPFCGWVARDGLEVGVRPPPDHHSPGGHVPRRSPGSGSGGVRRGDGPPWRSFAPRPAWEGRRGRRLARAEGRGSPARRRRRRSSASRRRPARPVCGAFRGAQAPFCGAQAAVALRGPRRRRGARRDVRAAPLRARRSRESHCLSHCPPSHSRASHCPGHRCCFRWSSSPLRNRRRRSGASSVPSGSWDSVREAERSRSTSKSKSKSSVMCVGQRRCRPRLDPGCAWTVTLRTPADVGCCAHAVTVPGQAEAGSLALASWREFEVQAGLSASLTMND